MAYKEYVSGVSRGADGVPPEDAVRVGVLLTPVSHLYIKV